MTPLDHGADRVLQQLIADLDLGSIPSVTPAGAWPVYAPTQPDAPDTCITCVETEPERFNRNMVDGTYPGRHGVQLLVRAQSAEAAKAKAADLAYGLTLIGNVYDTRVTVSGTNYRVHSIGIASGPLYLGRETPQSRREQYSLNLLVQVKQE